MDPRSCYKRPIPSLTAHYRPTTPTTMEVLRSAPCVLLLFSQLFLLLVAQQAPGSNPASATKEFTCVDEGLFPDPEDCHSYYRCTSTRQATHETCFWFSYFHPLIRGCTIGGCSIWTKPSRFGLPVANTTATSPTPFQCPTVGQFPDPKDCRNYYNCDSNLKAQRHTCFFGLGHYDIDNNVCSVGWC